MPSQSELHEDLNWLSERISNRNWTISIGVMAFCITFIVESAGSQQAPFLDPKQVVGPIVLALLSLVFDIMQYIAAYSLSHGLLTAMESTDVDKLGYDRKAPAYRVRVAAFRVKVALSLAAAAWLIFVVGQRALE